MLAWYIFVLWFNFNKRTASSILKAPSASQLAVYSGDSKLTATWLCAPRLYISSGDTFSIILIIFELSVDPHNEELNLVFLYADLDKGDLSFLYWNY